ncbi:hypothetical protein JTB14_003997 [Gonioctena quinquepunctata]|nr:hypothetical protein JTB14_003997 [Gonioctena quinquepunctata]
MEKFVAAFLCPICFTYMMPPIRQCTQGHCFCIYCFNSTPNCEICGDPKSNVPCLKLARMHALLNFPCKFEDEGCDFVGKGTGLGTHHIICRYKYSPTLCPLRFVNCRWRGKKLKMLDHCREEHPDNIFFMNKKALMVPNFMEPMNRNNYIILSVFDTLFRCTWDLSSESGEMRFAVYHMGSPLIQEQYSFKFSILSGFKNTEVIRMEGPCFQMDSDCEIFMGEKYLSANYSLIKEFCDEDGDLQYSVTVSKNNADQ